MNKTLRILALVATLLSLPALADASDQKTFTVTVTGAESVTIDTGGADLTATYDPNPGGSSSSNCSVVDRFCAWYPTIIYSTNYATNRQLVATATVSDPVLSVELEKQSAYPDPFVPSWGSGSQPGVWGDDFAGSTVTLGPTAKQADRQEHPKRLLRYRTHTQVEVQLCPPCGNLLRHRNLHHHGPVGEPGNGAPARGPFCAF